MYFDFEDLRPETPSLESPISRREAVLLAIIFHLAVVILLLVWPHLPFVKAMYARQEEALEEQRRREMDDLKSRAQFVFAEPRLKPEKPPPQVRDLSDQDARRQTRERPRDPRNDMPFSRGNTPENVIAEAQPGQPEPAAPPSGDQGAAQNQGPSNPDALTLPNSPVATIARNDPDRDNPARGPAPGILSDAIRNVQRYAKGESLQNVQGSGSLGPSFQFDSKGVDFGAWLRRFRAQVYRNWFIPYASMSLHGNVVLTFYVHRDGAITDLQIVRPSDVKAFTTSAYNALLQSNPTMPLPAEYPDEQMQMTVTFYINEFPPAGTIPQ
ncbi:MAG: TonB family protein [Acidobacteria bacterium]|nr:TonB family protein [Acidobacteriota bacterium]